MNPLTSKYEQADIGNLDGAQIMGQHLLLRMYPQIEKTEGGITLTEGSQDKRTAAWVIGIGWGLEDSAYHLGDTVMCPTAALMNVLPELDPSGKIRYILTRDVVIHWPAKEKA